MMHWSTVTTTQVAELTSMTKVEFVFRIIVSSVGLSFSIYGIKYEVTTMFSFILVLIGIIGNGLMLVDTMIDFKRPK